MDGCDHKEEILRMLLFPLEVVAHRFGTAFSEAQVYCFAHSFDWEHNTVTLRFDALHQPTGDTLVRVVKDAQENLMPKDSGLKIIYKGTTEHHMALTGRKIITSVIEMYVTIVHRRYGLDVLSTDEEMRRVKHSRFLSGYTGAMLGHWNRPVQPQDYAEARSPQPNERVPVVRVGLYSL